MYINSYREDCAYLLLLHLVYIQIIRNFQATPSSDVLADFSPSILHASDLWIIHLIFVTEP